VLIVHSDCQNSFRENSKSTEEEIKKSKSIIDYFFTIEDIIGNEAVKKELFKILKI
jgi:hypothetical protein